MARSGGSGTYQCGASHFRRGNPLHQQHPDEGRKVAITSPQQAIGLGLAYVPEDRQLHGLIPAMKHHLEHQPADVIQYANQGWLQDKAERKAAYNAAVQMEVRANNIWQLARELSGGNQQKIVLSKCCLPTRNPDFG